MPSGSWPAVWQCRLQLISGVDGCSEDSLCDPSCPALIHLHHPRAEHTTYPFSCKRSPTCIILSKREFVDSYVRKDTVKELRSNDNSQVVGPCTATLIDFHLLLSSFLLPSLLPCFCVSLPHLPLPHTLSLPLSLLLRYIQPLLCVLWGRMLRILYNCHYSSLATLEEKYPFLQPL